MKYHVPVTLRYIQISDLEVEANSEKEAKAALREKFNALEFDWESAQLKRQIHWKEFIKETP